MSLTPAEREASLVYDEESNQYNIFCSSLKEITRMKRAGFEPYKVDAEGNWFVKVDRNQISFRSKSNKPRKKREMTEEHKAKLLAGLEKSRKAKKEVIQSED